MLRRLHSYVFGLSKIFNPEDVVQKTNEVYYDEQGLNQLMEPIPEGTQVLSLSGNLFQSVPAVVLDRNSLTTLILNSNCLHSLPEQICHLRNLTHLSVRQNGLQEIPGSLWTMHKLQYLDASQNSITELNLKGIVPPLQKLYLSENKLRNIPLELYLLVSLEYLDLSKNRIGYVPFGIEALTELSFLNLAWNLLVDVQTITKLHKVVKIQLEHNEIKHLQALWMKSMSVRDLTVSCNRSLGPTICLSETMATLRGRSCSVKFISAPSTPMNSALTLLDLCNNQLHSISEDVIKLPLLERLLLSNNLIGSLPDLSNCKKLSVLAVSYNERLFVLPPLPEGLTELYAAGCGLKTVTSQPLPCLTQMHVAMNDLAEPPSRKLFPSLTYMDIEGNLFSPWQGRAGLSHTQGRRPQMEDETYYAKGDRFELLGLFDGHGGPFARHLPKIVEAVPVDTGELMDPQSFLTVLMQTMHECMKKVYPVSPCGSTVLFALVTKSYCLLAYKGDSRALIISLNGRLQTVTEDHKSNEDKEYVKKHGGNVDPSGRINGIINVYRTIGDYDLQQYMPQDPSFRWWTRDQTDKHLLIMACDGVFDVLDNEEVASFASKIWRRTKSVQDVATALRDHAYTLGSTDNITVMVHLL